MKNHEILAKSIKKCIFLRKKKEGHHTELPDLYIFSDVNAYIFSDVNATFLSDVNATFFFCLMPE